MLNIDYSVVKICLVAVKLTSIYIFLNTYYGEKKGFQIF